MKRSLIGWSLILLIYVTATIVLILPYLTSPAR